MSTIVASAPDSNFFFRNLGSPLTLKGVKTLLKTAKCGFEWALMVSSSAGCVGGYCLMKDSSSIVGIVSLAPKGHRLFCEIVSSGERKNLVSVVQLLAGFLSSGCRAVNFLNKKNCLSITSAASNALSGAANGLTIVRQGISIGKEVCKVAQNRQNRREIGFSCLKLAGKIAAVALAVFALLSLFSLISAPPVLLVFLGTVVVIASLSSNFFKRVLLQR